MNTIKLHLLHIVLIAMIIRSGRTPEEREAGEIIRRECIGRWLMGNLELPEGSLDILLNA